VNRLQKKCFIASAGIHLLLALILFIGPGFLPSHSKPDDLPLLTFVPLKTVDELISGGGSPKARSVPLTAVQQPPQPQSQAAPPPPKPTPEPEPEPIKVREPEPVKETKAAKQEEEPTEAKDPPVHKVEISKKLITRKRDSSSDKQAREEAQARKEAKALADARRKLARQFGQAAEAMGSSLSGGTEIEMPGPGGGGPTYANFLQAVKSAYDRAWVLPEGVIDDDAVTVASVTIRRDGTVVSHRITRRSGDSVVDHSVENTLERVTYAAPLPDAAKENTRTITISFSVKAKRLLG
jgi:TonB family protein